MSGKTSFYERLRSTAMVLLGLYSPSLRCAYGNIEGDRMLWGKSFLWWYRHNPTPTAKPPSTSITSPRITYLNTAAELIQEMRMAEKRVELIEERNGGFAYMIPSDIPLFSPCSNGHVWLGTKQPIPDGTLCACGKMRRINAPPEVLTKEDALAYMDLLKERDRQWRAQLDAEARRI
jgi:hypothetical protein